MSWEENVRKVVPYVAGEQPKSANKIKLNTNECPYPPAPGVTEALAGLKPEDFRLYPDPNAGTRCAGADRKAGQQCVKAVSGFQYNHAG